MVLASSRKIITKVLKKKRLTLKEKKARKEKTQQTIKNEEIREQEDIEMNFKRKKSAYKVGSPLRNDKPLKIPQAETPNRHLSLVNSNYRREACQCTLHKCS